MNAQFGFWLKTTVFLWFEMKFPSSACSHLRTPPLPLFSQGELHDEEEHMHSVALIDHKRTASYLRVQAVFKSSFTVLFYGTGCQKTH